MNDIFIYSNIRDRIRYTRDKIQMHLMELINSGTNKVLVSEIDRKFNLDQLFEAEERKVILEDDPSFLRLNLLPASREQSAELVSESVEIQLDSKEFLESLSKLNGLALEEKVVYVGVILTAEAFVFAMLVGSEGYHVACAAEADIDKAQICLKWVGEMVLKNEIVLMTYTGMKYELILLTGFVRGRFDNLTDLLNSTLSSWYYASGVWKDIVRVDLVTVVGEKFKTKDLLNKKGYEPVFLAACLGENINAARYQTDSLYELIHSLQTYRLSLLKRFWEMGFSKNEDLLLRRKVSSHDVRT